MGTLARVPGPHFTMTLVPVYLIQCFRSSLPHPVLQFLSTSFSAPVPSYLLQCSTYSLPHPVSNSIPPVFHFQSTSSSLQFQSTLSSLQIQFTSTSAPVQKTLISLLFLIERLELGALDEVGWNCPTRGWI